LTFRINFIYLDKDLASLHYIHSQVKKL